MRDQFVTDGIVHLPLAVRTRKVLLTTAISTLAVMWSGVARADEDQPANADEESSKSEIVVTGTLIRGVAPGGTNVIAISQQKVQETGAASTSQLLQTIPQFGAFNSIQTLSSGGNFVTTNRPNLRNLPGFTTNGSSPTLMLVNGHRVVGMGIQSTSPDADIVPPGIVERVDVVPDGGSAIYGSDAVAGVINFVTRKKVDGIDANIRYGFADNYKQVDANITAGKSWSTGSAYISYSFFGHSSLKGGDRDFFRLYPQNTGLKTATGDVLPVTSLECPTPNVVVGTNVFGLPYTTGTGASKLGQPNQCDYTHTIDIYPRERRHSVFAGINQQLSDAAKLEMNVFYMNRVIDLSLDPFRATVTIASNAASPYYSQFNATGAPNERQSVSFQIPSLVRSQHATLQAWGIDPQLTVNLGGGWQVRALASYSKSITEQRTPGVNSTALASSIAAGLLNPYNPGTSTPGVAEAVFNFARYGKSVQTQFDGKIVFDGELFKLPGGGVKLAFGGEYIKETFQSRKGDAVPGAEVSGAPAQVFNGVTLRPAVAGLPVFDLGRNIKSVFGELVVPLFGADNATAGFRELSLSVSGRFDDYSDVGHTFNPKVGVTWKPTDWLKFRGSWGKSFAAPSLADSSLSDPTNFNWVTGGTFSFLVPSVVMTANGYPAPVAGQYAIVLLGSKPGIEPQKAQTWSFGFDMDVPFVPRLHLSTTYFKIDYKGLISQPPFTLPATYFSSYKPAFVVNPTQAQVDAAIAGGVSFVGTPCSPLPTCVYIIEDDRKQNLGKFKVSGLDFSLNYELPTHFGSVDLTLGGTYELDREQAASATAAYDDVLAAGNVGRFKLRTTLGANIGKLRSQITWNHNDGYKVIPAVGVNPPQVAVTPFDVFDLYIRYDVSGEGAFKDLAFTLNVNNLFDTAPPVLKANSLSLSTQGFPVGTGTLGRFIQFGVSKKF